MASYKYGDFLIPNQSAAFDETHSPGVVAPYAGVYRCTGCGYEIGTAGGHTLPPQGHHQHPAGGKPILWQLLVFAQHKS